MTSRISFDKPKWSRTTRVVLALLLLVSVAAGVLLYLKGEPVVQASRAPARVPSPLAVGSEAVAAATAPSAPPAIAATRMKPPATPPGLHSSEDEFRRLMASADRRDHARGYLMAWECANEDQNLRMNERVPGAAPIDPKCGLAPGTWQSAEARKKGVIAAARLGLPNGWSYLLEEGPGGRLAAFSEAERAEWERLVEEAYPIALEAKDSAALGYEAVMQEAAGNYARAATLYVASAAALARRTNQPYMQPEETLAQLRPKLSAADLNRAIVEGRKMADTVKAGELL